MQQKRDDGRNIPVTWFLMRQLTQIYSMTSTTVITNNSINKKNIVTVKTHICSFVECIIKLLRISKEINILAP